MTVKKQTRCSGLAAIIARQRLQNLNQQIDLSPVPKIIQNFNISVCFNDKDQLQLTNNDEKIDNRKIDTIRIDDITNCVNVETYPNCANTLVFYVVKNSKQDALALKFENEQDFKRVYFTYKYFKMRNRLTKNSNYTSVENLFVKKKTYNDTLKIRKNSIDHEKTKDFDLFKTTDNNGVMHISVQQKNFKHDQPLSLIGITSRTSEILGEIDSVIYTDDIPIKTDKRRIFQKTSNSANFTGNKENSKILKGQFVRVNVDRIPDVVPKEIKSIKIPDILSFKEKPKNQLNTNKNIWTSGNKGGTGYESDREEWRSRSQFSTSAFDSLSRPAKMALSLRKPVQRSPPVPRTPAAQRPPPLQPREPQPSPYYRFGDPNNFRPDNFLPRPPRIPRPHDFKRNQLNVDHRKFASLQNLDAKKPEKKSNISNRISDLTNKLKDLGTNNTLSRYKAQSQTDVANLKPVIKKNDGTKRAVMRTCSAEPPKKVTFSAFATVQVV